MLGKGAGSSQPTAQASNDTTSAGNIVTSTANSDIDNQMLEVSRHGGIRLARTDSYSSHGRRATSIVIGKSSDEIFDNTTSLPPIKILEAQTACTEIRGGQAGGYSCFEHKNGVQSTAPLSTRVRLVARKRHPLAADLAKLFMSNGGNPESSSILTGTELHELYVFDSVPFLL